MSRARRIYCWILVSLFLQCLILFYLNHFFSFRKAEVTATNYELDARLEKDVTLEVPKDAAMIRTSFDAFYAAYVIEGKLEIMDVRQKEKIKTIQHQEGIVTYCKWLPDRNLIVYALKLNKESGSGVQIFTYDVLTGVSSDYPGIKNISTQSEVMEIELSPLTNMVYAKIKLNDRDTGIYKFNIMENVSYIMNVNIDTVIKETNYSDKLLYQGKSNRIYVRDGMKGSKNTLPFNEDVVLLGIDYDDQVYVGVLDKNSKVKKILHGRLDEEIEKKWSTVLLEAPVPKDKMIITNEGSILEIRDFEHVVYNILSKQRMSYTGQLIEVLDGCIVSSQQGDLFLQVVEN